MYRGGFKVGTTVWYVEQVRNAGLQPVAADALPTFRVEDASGALITSGVCTVFDASLTGAYLVSFLSNNPGFARGQSYLVVVQYAVASAARATQFYFNVT